MPVNLLGEFNVFVARVPKLPMPAQLVVGLGGQNAISSFWHDEGKSIVAEFASA